MEKEKEIIEWLEVAREWRLISNTTAHVQGRRESDIRAFASKSKIDPSSVRRCFAALRFAELLLKTNKIKSVDDLASTSLERLTIAQRVARLDMDAAVELLASSVTIRELRKTEKELRANLAGRTAALPDANLIVRRFALPLFRDAAIEAYLSAARKNGRETLTLTRRGSLIEAFHVLSRSMVDGPFQAARMVPAPALKPYPGRHTAIANLAVAMARIVEQFDLVVESFSDGESIRTALRLFGPCGVSVLFVTNNGSLEEIHPASRLKAPDLLPSHVKALNSRFDSARK